MLITAITSIILGWGFLMIAILQFKKLSNETPQKRNGDGKFSPTNDAIIEYISGLADTFNNKEIAEIVGVHASTISRIKNKNNIK